MKFLKIGNTILNISQIECVTENLVTVGYVDNDNSPFAEAIKEVKGVQVFMIDASSHGGCMNYTYSSITRVLLIQHKVRVKTYSDINLFGIEACIKDFVNTWGYRHD